MKVKLQQIIEAIEKTEYNLTPLFDRKERKIVWSRKLNESYEILSKFNEGTRNRYYCLPMKSDVSELGIIKDFVQDYPEGVIKDKLSDAISGKGAARRFKDLIHYYNIEKEWNEYRAPICKMIAICWCNDKNLEYDEI